MKDQETSSNDSKSSSRENTKSSLNANTDSVEKTEEVTSPTKHRISGGIQALMSKLNLVKTDNSNKDNMLSPLDIDMYCNSNTGKGRRGSGCLCFVKSMSCHLAKVKPAVF